MIELQKQIVHPEMHPNDCNEIACDLTNRWIIIQPFRPILDAYFANTEIVIYPGKFKKLFKEWDKLVEILLKDRDDKVEKMTANSNECSPDNKESNGL